MIYHCLTLNNLTTDQGDNISKNVLFALEYNKEVLTYKDLISNAFLLEQVNVEGFLKLAKTQEYPAMLVTVNSSDPTKVVTWDYLLGMIRQQTTKDTVHLPEVVQHFSNGIVQCLQNVYAATGGIDVETASKLYTACVDAEDYFRDEQNNIKVSNFDLIDTHFREATVSKSDSAVGKWDLPEIETLKQVQCTDKLSIKLPQVETVHKLINGGSFAGLYFYLPKRKDVSMPYETLNPSADFATYKDINSGITSDKYYLIEGKTENNTLDIQENEKEFYDYLNQWILTSVRYASQNDKLGENGDYNSIIIDKTTETFLDFLLEYFYAWHWRHNRLMTEAGDIDDDEDDEVVSSQETMGDYTFINKPDTDDAQAVAPAYILLCNYAKTVCKNKGFTAYSELIVKLLRWGERKPTAINFNGYPELFELGTCKVHSYIGNVEDYEIAYDTQGYSQQIVNWLESSLEISDLDYLRKLGGKDNHLKCPIGAKVGTHYINKKTNEQIIISKYYSLGELVECIMANDKFVKGVRYENGEIIADEAKLRDVVTISFSMDESIQAYEANKATQLVNPFYVSDSIKLLKLELGLNETAEKFNGLSVICDVMQTSDLEERFSCVSGKSNAEINEAINNFELNSIIEAATLKKGNEIYPIYVKTDQLLKDGKLQSYTAILNTFASELNGTLRDEIPDTTNAESMSIFSNSDSVAPVEQTQISIATTPEVKQESVSEATTATSLTPSSINTQPDTQEVNQADTTTKETEQKIRINNPELMYSWFKETLSDAFIKESTNLTGAIMAIVTINKKFENPDNPNEIQEEALDTFLIVQDVEEHITLFNLERLEELQQKGVNLQPNRLDIYKVCKYIGSNLYRLLKSPSQPKTQFTFASLDVLENFIRTL